MDRFTALYRTEAEPAADAGRAAARQPRVRRHAALLRLPRVPAPGRRLPRRQHPLRRHAAQRAGGALLPRGLLPLPHGILLNR